MNKIFTLPLIASVVMSALLVGPAWAEKPDWAGNGNSHGKGDKHEKYDQKENKKDKKQKYDNAPDVRSNNYFTAPQRLVINNYYGQPGQNGRCPPGLAKKNNGCMPPGQARKWAVGQPLPSSVVYYPVPSAVTVQLGAPPAGHKYVRVAGDILLIAIGTSMIVDAVTDLGRL